MDYQPTTGNNEDEFAKALNNLSGDVGTSGGDFFADSNDTSYLNQTDDGVKTSWGTPAAMEQSAAPEAAQQDTSASAPVTEEQPVVAPEPEHTAPAFNPEPAMGGGMTDLKTSVLTDLRPVIDNVEIGPDEKYELLSTLFHANHDSSLIEPAYAAARQISDDTKRAESLLNIVHDIDSVQ